jgi:hypothetical protein
MSAPTSHIEKLPASLQLTLGLAAVALALYPLWA